MKLPKFETHNDNDKPINWQYVKDVYKNFFSKRNLSAKEKLENERNFNGMLFMEYIFIAVVFALYFFYPPFETLMTEFLDDGGIGFKQVLLIVGSAGIFFIANDYFWLSWKARKKLKELEKNGG